RGGPNGRYRDGQDMLRNATSTPAGPAPVAPCARATSVAARAVVSPLRHRQERRWTGTSSAWNRHLSITSVDQRPAIPAAWRVPPRSNDADRAPRNVTACVDGLPHDRAERCACCSNGFMWGPIRDVAACWRRSVWEWS